MPSCGGTTDWPHSIAVEPPYNRSLLVYYIIKKIRFHLPLYYALITVHCSCKNTLSFALYYAIKNTLSLDVYYALIRLCKKNTWKYMLKIHEVWHFPESQRREGLFAPYVNTWLKHKTEASGWSKACNTEEKKATYVSQYVFQKITLIICSFNNNRSRALSKKIIIFDESYTMPY